MPLVSSENCFSLTRSTGSDSTGVASSRWPANENVAHAQHRDVEPERNCRGRLELHYFEPCSNSVTKATRWKPAADSRPITFIMVP